MSIRTDPETGCSDWSTPSSSSAIVDVPTGKLVTNDFPQIALDFSTEWPKYHRPGAPDLYPEQYRAEIDEMNHAVYNDVNAAVCQAGFASRQAVYDAAIRASSGD